MADNPTIKRNKKLNIKVQNIDPNNAYTYRFFGIDTGLPSVDNNNPIQLPTTVGKINVGTNPTGGIFIPTNGLMYFTNFGSGTISLIDANNNVVNTITLGNQPQGGVFCPVNNCLYITDNGDNKMLCIDVNPSSQTYNTVIATIPTGNNPQGVIFVPDNGYLYIQNNQSATLTVVNPITNTVVATTSFLGGNIVGFQYIAYNRSIYVASIFENNLQVVSIDTNDVYATIPVGNGPRGSAYDSVHQRLYTANHGDTDISVSDITTNTSLGSISTAPFEGGVGAIFIAANQCVYVAGATANQVYVIDTTQGGIGLITTFIQAGNNTQGLLYNPDNGYIYVSNSGDNTLNIIDTSNNTNIQTIAIGNGPRGAILNPLNNMVYISIFNDNQVAYLTNNSYIPVTIVVNGGLITIGQLNSQNGSNAMEFDCIKIDTSSLQAIITDILKKDWESAGKTIRIPINILKERVSEFNPSLYIVEVCGDKISDRIVNGTKYIEHIIPAASVINYVITYSQIDSISELGGDMEEMNYSIEYTAPVIQMNISPSIDSNDNKKKKKKRYSTAKSF